VMPPVVTGYILLILFGRRGVLGAFLAEQLGIVFAFRWTGAALACAVMGFPLMVRSIRLSIEAVDRRLEAAAATLGANRAWVWLTVTLPLILPGIVAGMTIGSTVHGLGATFLEDFVYDENGQLLATTFMDYLKPVAATVPHIQVSHMYSPCPYTLLGTKSAGEGGAIGSLAAVANAVEDALTPFGVKITSLPLTPEKVVRAIKETKVI